MTREKAVKDLLGELDAYKRCEYSADDVAWAFIYCIAVVRDASLIELAPPEIGDRVREVVKAFREQGSYRVITPKGELRDLSEIVGAAAGLLV